MSLVFDYIRQEVERTNEEIIRDMPRDEGTAAQSLRVEEVGSEVRSIGLARIEYLDRGSAPWANPENFRKLGFILDKSGWSDRKGVSAYAAAYSIAHNGSQIFQGKKEGIQLEKKIETLKQRLKENLPNFVRTELINNMRHGKST